MARPEFALTYPQTLTPPEYVDKLNAQAGSPLAQVERDRLVAGMLLGTETRATVLRKVAESPEFTRRETNRALGDGEAPAAASQFRPASGGANRLVTRGG